MSTRLCVLPCILKSYSPHLFYCGERALTTCVAPPVSCSVAVTFFGGCLETRPQKKLLSPLPGDPPSHTGEANVNLMVLPVWTAEARPIVPMPPPVTTKT